jgi:hypothetical protein
MSILHWTYILQKCGNSVEWCCSDSSLTPRPKLKSFDVISDQQISPHFCSAFPYFKRKSTIVMPSQPDVKNARQFQTTTSSLPDVGLEQSLTPGHVGSTPLTPKPAIWERSWASSTHLTSSQIVSLTSILMLSCPPLHGLSSDRSPRGRMLHSTHPSLDLWVLIRISFCQSCRLQCGSCKMHVTRREMEKNIAMVALCCAFGGI